MTRVDFLYQMATAIAEEPSDWVNLTAQISLAVLVVALGLAFLRLVLGPSLPDRVVALDLVATLLVGLIAVSAVETGDVIFLRVAMVVALFNFIGTIGFCWYLQRGSHS